MDKFIKLSKALVIVILLFSTINKEQVLFGMEDVSANLELSQTPPFGFTPAVKINIPITDKITLIPYVECWFQNSYSDTLGYIYPGTEMGLGVNLNLLNNKLDLFGSLGFYNGNSFSGGGRFAIAEAFIPILKANYQFSDKISIEFYSKAWFQTRLISYVRARLDEFNICVDGKYKLNKLLDLGLFFDQIIVNQKFYYYTDLYTNNIVAGAFVKFNTNKATLYLGLGADLVDYINSNVSSEYKIIREYYKIKANIKL
jgi:hypothetical protein